MRFTPWPTVLGLVSTVFALVSAASPAEAQCADWRARGIEMQLTGGVYDSKEWDPDGAGPLQSVLVLGGGFDRVGGPAGIVANNVATWNGTQWQALAGGLTYSDGSTASVSAVEVWNGQLYVAGGFDRAGGVAVTGIAKWTGTGWQAVGGAFGVVDPQSRPYIRDMHVYNGELFVCGRFESIGGVPMYGVARWNGTAWQTLAPGNVAGDATFTYCLGDHNGSLYIGGGFSSFSGVTAHNIVRWTGSIFVPVGSGPPTRGGETTWVWDIKSYQGELVVAGLFSSPGGLECSNVAAWNGSAWRFLGCGVWSDDYFDRRASVLHVHNNDLYVGGHFALAGGTPAWCVARWNGTAWSSVGEGLNGVPAVGWGPADVDTFATYQGSLYAGGWILNSGAQRLDSIARFDGAQWQDVGDGVVQDQQGGVFAIGAWNGRVVAGGNFYVYDPEQYGVYGLYSFTGSRMTADLGGAVAGAFESRIVRSIVSYPRNPPISSDIYVAGDFTTIGRQSGGSGSDPGVPANRIATRNSLTGIDWSPMGDGFNNSVTSVTRFNGSIHAAGAFTASGTTTVNRIAKWTGSAWTPLTTFPNASPDNCNGTIHAMKAYTSGISGLRLAVGGEFTTIGGLSASRVAVYNASSIAITSSWSTLGQGFNGTVVALEHFGGSLYAGGDFTASGPTTLSRIARWNGSAWVDVGGGINGSVYCMIVSNGTLVVGGSFTAAGGVPCNNLARWNGTAWSPIGGGTDGLVRCLAVYQNELHVGGEFTTVRGGVIESAQWARFSETGVPWIARHPFGETADCGTAAQITFEPAAGYGGLVYQWYKDNVPVGLGPTGNGSTIVGAGTALTIADMTPADRGSYWCVLSNGCGSVTTSPATLTPGNGCPFQCDQIDFNRDTLFPDTSDITDFLTVFAGGVCAGQQPTDQPCNADIDFNNDGLFPDTDDIGAMIRVFSGGPCV